jgi:hypothetical protein
MEMKGCRKVEEIGKFLCIDKSQMETKKKTGSTVDSLTLVGFENFFFSYIDCTVDLFLCADKCGELMRSKL